MAERTPGRLILYHGHVEWDNGFVIKLPIEDARKLCPDLEPIAPDEANTSHYPYQQVTWFDKSAVVWVSVFGQVFEVTLERDSTIEISKYKLGDRVEFLHVSAGENPRIRPIPATVASSERFAELETANGTFVSHLGLYGMNGIETWESSGFTRRLAFLNRF